MVWKPGRQDEALRLEAAYPDVPDHLVAPLIGWILDEIATEDMIRAVALRLRLAIPEPRTAAAQVAATRALIDRCNDPGALLDTVEAILHVRTYGTHVYALERLLDGGNSMYRVREDGRGLDVRVLPEVKATVESALAAGPRAAGEHLAMAWEAAYSRTPDPVRAYSEAIKAVEAAAIPVVSPKNTKATLGTVIADMRANSTKFVAALDTGDVPGVSFVIEALRLLWTGQTSRHGGVGPTRSETPEASRAAVVLASTAVHWFSSGGVTHG